MSWHAHASKRSDRVELRSTLIYRAHEYGKQKNSSPCDYRRGFGRLPAEYRELAWDAPFRKPTHRKYIRLNCRAKTPKQAPLAPAGLGPHIGPVGPGLETKCHFFPESNLGKHICESSDRWAAQDRLVKYAGYWAPSLTSPRAFASSSAHERNIRSAAFWLVARFAGFETLSGSACGSATRASRVSVAESYNSM